MTDDSGSGAHDPSPAQKAHKGTDKWFALGDELDGEHAHPELPLWQRHRMRIALAIAVGIVLIVAAAAITARRKAPPASPAAATSR